MPNADIVEWYALVGVVSFLLGELISGALAHRLTIQTKGNYKENRLNFDVLIGANTVLLFMSITLLIASIGISGIFSMATGDTTLNMSLGKGGMLRNVYIIVLNMLGASTLFSFFTAKNNSDVKRTYLYFVAFFLQTALFSYARSGIIYTALIIGMYALKDKNRRYQVVSFLLIGCICIALMVFGGYLRSFGTKAVGDFFSYLGKTDDWTRFMLNNLDFSAAYVWFSRLIEKNDVWINPIVYLKPLLLFIPRSIAPWKPEALTVQILKQLSPGLAASGFSTGMSLLGEAYAILGKIGFVVYPFIWGGACIIMDHLHFYRLKTGDYSPMQKVFYYYFATMIIIESQRGDFGAACSTFLVSVMLPILLIIYLSKTIQFTT